jgi:putative spermidine/putrescine transport system ATP-binding protein
VPETAISLRSVVKDFPGHRAVDNVDLDVVDGELLAVLGPSGCGKTTTLRMIAGLTLPTAGTIVSRGRDITLLPPNRRNLGMVFQSYALFPHMTVWDNIAYGLKMRRAREIAPAVQSALELVRLDEYKSSYPRQLSGGQQQRVALARAIAISPDALLLDEPLSNLDLKLRTELRMELSELRRRMGWTTLFVTHDQTEALSMADRVAVMNGGVLQQIGTPSEIYQRPRNRFVASFVGESNILDGVAQQGHLVVDGRYRVALPTEGPSDGAAATISVRPEAVSLQPLGEHRNGWPTGTVVTKLYGGASVRYVVELETGRRVVADLAAGLDPANPGDTVGVIWPSESSICLEEGSE